ncbi:PVC-type heme-binding CxxCH protein [Novipirellula sp. SH528]|uniref:PVC-type heme-binding CxxCH protein n=1 Tax=Novipirellula sp. SH528 TaxID=3454466 RepID=UPI003FA0B932
MKAHPRFSDRLLLMTMFYLAPLLMFGFVTGELSANEPASTSGPDYSDELPRIAPTEPDAALSTFTVADGFQMQQVAAEPLLGSPVAIEWDEHGAMYVCEMRGYSENREDGISTIAKLTDSDGDGIYDKRVEFARGLFWPTALFPYDGGLFVGDAPDLLYLKDTNGDGAADVKQRVLTGFGTSNVQGLMNSFRWGLDNRIHIACSSVGGEIRHAHAAPDVAGVSIRGRDLAFNPRTYEFEPTSGAAQHGMCFDDWGRKFVSSNSDHIQQVMYEDDDIAKNPFVVPPPSRISIASDGPQAEVFRTSPVEPWRIVRTRLRVSGEVKGVVEGGGRAAGYFTGATGVTLYRGDAWPAKWKGHAIIGDVGSNLIHRKRLDRDGLEFVANRIDDQSEFVTSSDIWFRPAQFANAPDGTLHVIDVYREVIEHPLSLPESIKKHLDLTSGRDRGRIYRIVPTGYTHRSSQSLAGLTTSKLVKTLAHANAWHRETAARLLYQRQDPAAVVPLRSLVKDSPSPLGRMHAMYALDGLAALDEATLISGLRDKHPQVRRHALRLSDSIEFTPSIERRLVEMIDDESMEVRYQLAFALANTEGDVRVNSLARILSRDPNDRWIRAAVQTAIGDDAEKLLVRLKQDDSFNGKSAEAFNNQLSTQIAARARNALSNGGERPKKSVSTTLAVRSPEAIAHRQSVLAKYRDALSMQSDSDRGREHFKKHCSTCHRVENVGHEIGPNLATIKARGEETVLTAVLDPNREVNPQYINYVVSTLDGEIVSGMIVDEGATSMTLRRGDNVTATVLRIDIDELKNTGLSIMPEGFEDAMDKQAVADLIAYLMQAS